MGRRLTEKIIEGLAWTGKKTFVFDADLRGFGVAINKTGKIYFARREVWKGERGGRRYLKKGYMKIGRVGVVSLKQARDEAALALAQMARGEEPNPEQRAGGVTLRSALASCLDHMKRKNRSPITIRDYKYQIEKHLGDWLDEPLAAIGRDRRGVRDRHKRLTEEHGPGTANIVLRDFRAVYNYEKKVSPELPENPVISSDLNVMKPRDKFVSVEDLPAWKVKVEAIDNSVRRDLQLFLIFTGMRRTASVEARWEDFDEARRVLHVPRPKGGEQRAFDLPLSAFLLQLLLRRREENEALYPDSPWIFPSISKSGHVIEPKVHGIQSAHTLRHTYCTLAAACGVAFEHRQLLLNHKLPSVTATYTHRDGVLEKLREEQEKITSYLLEHMNKPVVKQERQITEQPTLTTLKQDNRIQEVTP